MTPRALAEKICRKCKTSKPLSDFYFERRGYYMSYCKVCLKQSQKTPEFRAKSLARYRKRMENPLEHQKMCARSKLRRFVRLGRIVKPIACPSCAASGMIQAHHSDYLKPYEVIWACLPCHREIHSLRAGELK